MSRRGRILEARAQHESEGSDPADSERAEAHGDGYCVVAEPTRRNCHHVRQIADNSTQGDSSPVQAALHQENRPHCAPVQAAPQQQKRLVVLH